MTRSSSGEKILTSIGAYPIRTISLPSYRGRVSSRVIVDPDGGISDPGSRCPIQNGRNNEIGAICSVYRIILQSPVPYLPTGLHGLLSSLLYYRRKIQLVICSAVFAYFATFSKNIVPRSSLSLQKLQLQNETKFFSNAKVFSISIS